MITDKQMENYIATLRLQLAPLTLGEREEIVMEIAAHVRDSAEQSGASVESVLARLGPAKELAAQYRDGLLIRRASRLSLIHISQTGDLKEAPLRRDVRSLGMLLGEVLREQAGLPLSLIHI